MKESQKSSEDRLSDLPNSIIIEIFGFLLMRDVVRTTILSKRWRHLWKTTPYLNFFGHSPKFVNRALILWRGFRILKFKFDIRNSSAFSDTDVWVCLAKENGIEELYIEDLYQYGCVLHSLYSCSSLKVLSLIGCDLLLSQGNVQWNQLRSLTIEDCIVDEDLINRVVSGSPQLEVFVLTLWDIDEKLSIRSSSLTKLSIERNFDDDEYEPSNDTELTIWSPNLETLDILGEPYAMCTLMNVPCLTHLTLDISRQICEEDISGQTFCQILPTIKHVDEGLGDMKNKYLLSPLSNVKFLAIASYATQYEEIVDLLCIFPKLETLVLQSIFYLLEPEHNATSFLQLESNLPESFLLQLRTVKITLSDEADDFIFPFIEILLKHASNLHKMEIRVGGIKQPLMPWFLAARQKVLRMPRSSPTAELIFAVDS